MSIQSMTGFGRGQASEGGLQVGIEIKSVNHRFMDTRFKIPSDLLEFELPLKKRLSGLFKRGTFDIFISTKHPAENLVDKLDKEKIKKYIQEILPLAGKVPAQFSPTDFLRPEFYLEKNLKDNNLAKLIEKSFDEALEKLSQTRLAEGGRLTQAVKKHLASFKEHFVKVEALAETYREEVEARLKKRLGELKKEYGLEETRFYQEVVYYLEKLDIHEEIDRINSHLFELNSVIEGDGEVGRKIEFLLQELNRETNTIGSKAGLKEISESVVSMKVHIEKIREQALNLE
ncbi:MAG: YicC family protein [Deltaproteobacteria bacterium]|nr:MAG: YicC family protein [Deltaproteobacteria bacterium]